MLWRTSKDDAAKSTSSKTSSWLKRFGIDSDKIKETIKTEGQTMMLWGNFNVNKLKNAAGLNETQLTEPSFLEKIRRDMRNFKYATLHRAYTVYKSPETQEKIKEFKAFVTRQKYEIKEGLVKYNNFIFWWKVDSDKYGANFRKYWRMRRAYKDGALDFYMTTFLIIGGFTLFYGLFKGRGKSSK